MNEKKTLRQRYDEAEFKFRVGEKSLMKFLLEQEQKEGVEGFATKKYKQAKEERKKGGK